MLKYAATLTFPVLLLWGPVAAQAQPTTPATSQQQPAPERPWFADQVDVRLVHVDVRVERRGKPVSDLGVEDFVLLEDGEPVEIAVFSPPEPATPDEAPHAARTDDDAPPHPPRQPATSADGTVAMFVDDLSLGPAQRNRALRTVEALADPSNPHSEGLVVFRHFRRGRLTLQLGADALAEAPDAPKMSRTAAVREQQAIFFAMRDIENALSVSNCIDARGQLLAVADDYAASATASSELRSRLLADAVEYLSARPGRKVLVVVAGRIEIQPGVAILEHLQDLCPDLSSELSGRIVATQNMANRLHRVAGLANSHRVTLVTVDARGISAPTQANAAVGAARFAGSQMNQTITDSNLQSGLTQLASETGGRALFNANNIVKPVLRSLEQTDAVYTLAFYPRNERSGKRRILEVKLAGDAKKRTRLHYRRSYMDRTVQQEWADSLRTTARAPELRPDETLPNPLGARLTATADADGLVAALSLDAEAVETMRSLSPESERRLRLWLYVVDPEGRETTAREGFLTAPTEPGPWQIVIRMTLPAGEWTVAAGLRDEVTGEISLLRHTPAL